MRELVDDLQHPIFPSLMGAILDEAYDQTWFRPLGANRRHEPSASQSRLRLGCLAGTFSPSRRQILSTRLSLTTQPAVVRDSSAIFR